MSLTDDQWRQASLPVKNGGLGVRNAGMLASSAYLASAAATLHLQNAILMQTHAPQLQIQQSVRLLPSGRHYPEQKNRLLQETASRKSGTILLHKKIYEDLLSRCNNNLDKARLKATGAAQAEDWLNATPVPSLGLRLSDEAIRVAVRHRLRSSTCHSHKCVLWHPS